MGTGREMRLLRREGKTQTRKRIRWRRGKAFDARARDSGIEPHFAPSTTTTPPPPPTTTTTTAAAAAAAAPATITTTTTTAAAAAATTTTTTTRSTSVDSPPLPKSSLSSANPVIHR